MAILEVRCNDEVLHMIGKVVVTTKNPPCPNCGSMAGRHSKNCGFAKNEMRVATIEEIVADLKAAGWTKQNGTTWRSPTGGLHRGPFGAWKAELERRNRLAEERRPTRLNDPQRGDMWQFTSNYGDIVRHVKSVTRNGTVSYLNNGRFYQCSMATWRRWARGAELLAREKWGE